MREAKFRAKPLRNDSIDEHIEVVGKEWIYGSSPIKLGNGKQVMIFTNDEGMLTAQVIADGSSCEYTGLTDRNGVEIYESDIVRLKDSDYESDFEPVGHGFEVAWQADSGRWHLKWHYSDGDWYDDDFYAEEVEVIGNVWEHPGLQQA